MNSLLPHSHAADYITTVLTLYLQLPETPLHISSHDRTVVRQLYDRGISLPVIETALLLASLRRLLRPADLPQLAPIRSLAYFLPVIEELLAHPAPDNYLQYLRSKLPRMPNPKIARTKRTPADGQKNTFSDGR
jgi:hypothetical protein